MRMVCYIIVFRVCESVVELKSVMGDAILMGLIDSGGSSNAV